MKGDGGYDAAYIPSGADDPNVVFSSASVASAVMAHVNSTGLAAYKGGIAPRNAFNSPWISSLDLRITQDIDVMMRLYFASSAILIIFFVRAAE